MSKLTKDEIVAALHAAKESTGNAFDYDQIESLALLGHSIKESNSQAGIVHDTEPRSCSSCGAASNENTSGGINIDDLHVCSDCAKKFNDKDLSERLGRGPILRNICAEDSTPDGHKLGLGHVVDYVGGFAVVAFTSYAYKQWDKWAPEEFDRADIEVTGDGLYMVPAGSVFYADKGSATFNQDTNASLCDEYQSWTDEKGHPEYSADELLLELGFDHPDAGYIKEYIERWDAVHHPAWKK